MPTFPPRGEPLSQKMEPDAIRSYPTVKQSWGIVGLSILSMILFAIVQALLTNVAGEDLSFLIYYLLSVGLVFWIAHSKRKAATKVSTYSLYFGSVRTVILVSIAVVALQMGVVSPLVNLLPMPEFMKNLFIEFAKRSGVFSFIAIVVAAPVLEELIFRGIVLDGFLKMYSPVKSILISSALFGVIHLNPWQFISALVIGIFSGWVYYRTRNLTLSIIIHMVNNLAAVASMYYFDPEVLIDVSMTELYGGVLNSILITFGALLTSVICLYFLREEFKTGERSNESGQHNIEPRVP